MNGLSKLFVAGALLLAAQPASAQGVALLPGDSKPAVKAPSHAQVQREVTAWLQARRVPPSLRGVLVEAWKSSDGSSPQQRLDLLAVTAAAVDDNAARLWRLCAGPRPLRPVAAQPWLASSLIEPALASNLRLYYGRWLAQQGLYDEAYQQLAGLQPGDVVDPAGLLFYQAVACHALLLKRDGLAAIDRLIDETDDAPRRYLAVATLMREDLSGLEDDSLDHIARRMNDIRRRLALGRAGQRVQGVERGVIESLDKLIEEMEQQQQQQGGGSGGSQAAPRQAMQDSRIATGKGAGEVDPRDIGDTAGWGDLPPKQREEALQQIGKEFPAHYRDVIEQYFRSLATGEE